MKASNYLVQEWTNSLGQVLVPGDAVVTVTVLYDSPKFKVGTYLGYKPAKGPYDKDVVVVARSDGQNSYLEAGRVFHACTPLGALTDLY